MYSEDINGVTSPTSTKRRQFLYPESDWPQANTSPREENMPSLDVRPVDTFRPSSGAQSTCNSVARTNASSSSSAASGDTVSVEVRTLTLKKNQSSVSCKQNGVSGRKRKMCDRKTVEEKIERRNERKRRRHHICTRVTARTGTKNASYEAMETDAMRYGKLLGYNVVPDYNNYLVVRSAYGYGDISQSSAMTRRPKSEHLRRPDTHLMSDKVILRDKVDQLVRNGSCPRNNSRSDPNNYLVVQSAFGYGNISQSSSIKRKGVQFKTDS
ncbi:uncharacterized protein [Haliotis cracherodii]|uniref:uncharacterized protein n=1 Tax=Haliotis cracherodii TaxID=6455 RepID=UPI0039E7E953